MYKSTIMKKRKMHDKKVFLRKAKLSTAVMAGNDTF